MVAEFGPEKTLLLFADVKSEDEDTYAWGRAAAKTLGCELVEIAEGRTPWQVFEDSNFIGNSRVDMCSKVLKRDFVDRYIGQMFPNKYRTLRVFGIHWSEYDRFERWDKKTNSARGIYWRMRQLGWRYVRAPLCEKPFVSVESMESEVRDAGLWTQRLYALGFPHANCGGECVKQGQAGWALLYKTMPDRFVKRRDWEQMMRNKIGKDVAILSETVRGKKIALPLAELQRRLDAGKQCEEGGMGGCSCFVGDE